MLRRFLSLCVVTLCLATLCFAQEEAAKIDVSRIPAQAHQMSAFAPAGWKIEEQVTGDLNGNSVPDFALKLVEDKPDKDSEGIATERGRALVIVLTMKDGILKRVGVADKLLQCTRCGGAFYGVVETPVEVTIEKGVVVVQQDHGSREITNTTYRFRYDSATERFMLIGFDLNEADRATAQVVTESSNYLTGVRVVTRSKGDRDVMTKSAFPRKKVYLEDVSAEDFEFAAFQRLKL